jgi:hypothetical protein
MYRAVEVAGHFVLLGSEIMDPIISYSDSGEHAVATEGINRMANHESNASTDLDTSGQPPAKKLRLDGSSTVSAPIERPRGTAPVKAEYASIQPSCPGRFNVE